MFYLWKWPAEGEAKTESYHQGYRRREPAKNDKQASDMERKYPFVRAEEDECMETGENEEESQALDDSEIILMPADVDDGRWVRPWMDLDLQEDKLNNTSRVDAGDRAEWWTLTVLQLKSVEYRREVK